MTARSTPAQVDARVRGLTVPTTFLELAASRPAAVLLRARDAAGGWEEHTIGEVRDLAARAAAGLRANGVSVGDRVLLLTRNRPDFHWFDLGAQLLRATPVSIYNSSSQEEIEYLANHAGAEIAIVEDAGFLDRLLAARPRLPRLRRIFVLDPPAEALPDGVRPAAELLAHGAADAAALAAATSPDDLATLIYTSGTTGPPKGVMISQHNVVYTAELLRECLARERTELFGWRVVSYLPMAHIAERAVSHYLALTIGFEVTCCPDQTQLLVYLQDVRPNLLFGVPRVWEKLYAGINAALAADPGKQRQFDEGVAAAVEIWRAEIDGTATQEQRDAWAFLDAVAFSTVRQLVGLDQVEVAVTSAAPLPAQILEWFNAIGVPLSEVYGMSESTGPITWSPQRNRPGWVGQAIPGMEVAIADDGEVIARGGNVFQGYLGQPGKTADTVIDGWLHTGDIGEIDAEGYLRIVDRKKELIITSGGKNVSPANLEAALKMIPLVGQACAIGDQRKYVSALLVLDPDAARVWAERHGKARTSLAELAADPDVRAEVQAGIDRINAQFAQAEQIKRFVLVGEEWLPDSDVLTPTSKLKRRGILARYEREIEQLYS